MNKSLFNNNLSISEIIDNTTYNIKEKLNDLHTSIHEKNYRKI